MGDAGGFFDNMVNFAYIPEILINFGEFMVGNPSKYPQQMRLSDLDDFKEIWPSS